MNPKREPTLPARLKPSPISIAFGKAIKQQRLKKGITQEELADRCNLDRTYISRIERGLKNPTLSVVWDIATIGLTSDLLTLMALVVQIRPDAIHTEGHGPT